MKNEEFIKRYNKMQEFSSNTQGFLKEGEKELDFPKIPGINTDFLTDINVKI